MKEITLAAYFQRVGLNPSQLENLNPIERLKAVYIAHVLTFPYSNVKLRQLSWEHPLKRKILMEDYTSVFFDSKGGYCFQLALLLKDILEKMGYQVEACEARVLMGEDVNAQKVLQLPPTHLILKVIINGENYLLDPGLGSQSPRWPILITGKEESIIQPNEELRFSHLEKENLYVLERKTEKGWFRLIQTNLQPINKAQIEFNLLKLAHHLPSLEIRDDKMVIGRMLPEGRCSLLWLASNNQLKLIEKIGSESKEELLTSYEAAVAVIDKKFGIKLLPEDLKKYCTSNVKEGFLFFKTKKAWTVDFPLDEKTRKAMQSNLVTEPSLKSSGLQPIKIDPIPQKNKDNLFLKIEGIHLKAKDLKTRGFAQEATAAEDLAKFLKQKSTEFFSLTPSYQKEKFNAFYRKCKQQLDKANNNWAKKDRGYKHIFFCVLQSLTIIGAILGLIQWSVTGNYALFSDKTKSSEVLESAREALCQLK